MSYVFQDQKRPRQTKQYGLVSIHLFSKLYISSRFLLSRLVGWGDTSFNGLDSRILQQTSLQIMSSDRCKKVYKFYDKEYQMCAGVYGGGRGVCQGDSGGPLMYVKNGVW
jgi:hypothetical protein